VLVVALTLLLGAGQAPAANLDVSLSSHYSSGNYGGSDDIELVYVPLVAKLEIDAWTLRTVLPWLRVSGGTTTVEGPGGPIETKNGTADGFGDVLLEGSYAFAPLARYAPFIEVGARLKTPTAKESRGLGTGEFDITPEIEITREYGRWTPYVTVGFRVLGDSTSTTYRDGFLASAGISCRLFGMFEPGIFAYWKQAATKGSDDAVEILPVLRMEFGEQWMVDAYASAGFTDSTPDAGGGIVLHYRIRDVF